MSIDRHGPDLSKARPGVHAALNVIIERVTEGQPFTTVVLPTRYGKSDLIRMSAYISKQRGLVSTTLVLCPNRLLRDQMIHSKKVTEMMLRYGMFDRLKVAPIATPGKGYGSNGETVLSVTMQLVQRNIDNFTQWVNSVIYTTGLPPLIAIDEAHTGSEDNTWGDVVTRLVNAGARAVLVTATPIRSDGQVIPGFECEILSAEETKVYITRPGETQETVWVDVYEGLKQRVRLKAHHETTFREAWSENPSPLCKISRLPFDVELSRIGPNEYEDGIMLSTLKPTEARRALGRATRAPSVIKEGCERLVRTLGVMRQNAEDCAGIVFCGNDDSPEKMVNEHAKQIKAAIESIDHSLNVVIATSATGDDDGDAKADDRITTFVDGNKGDILIVKQMASVGLDAPRLKVELDLSPVRTVAAYVQRMMRIATPHGNIRHAVYISPDDCMGRALFDQLVTENDGEARVTAQDLIKSYEKEKDPKDRLPLFDTEGVAPAPFEDTHNNRAESHQLPSVEALISALPALITMYSHSQIANGLSSKGVTVAVPQLPVVENTDDETEELRKRINDLVNEIVKARMGGLYDQRRWQEYSQDAFVSAYRACSVPRGTKLHEIKDNVVLKKIKHHLDLMCAGVGIYAD